MTKLTLTRVGVEREVGGLQLETVVRKNYAMLSSKKRSSASTIMRDEKAVPNDGEAKVVIPLVVGHDSRLTVHGE
jgi:hypothetical protein